MAEVAVVFIRRSSALSSAMSHRSAERRLQVLAAHLTPDGERVQASSVVPNDASGAPYASATGAPSSYAKVSVCVCCVPTHCAVQCFPRLHLLTLHTQVHGAVSRKPAVWVSAAVEEGSLTEVLYEKTQGEGIAKARWRWCWLLPGVPKAVRLTHGFACCPAHAVQITINRPHRRNAFTPRTGEAHALGAC